MESVEGVSSNPPVPTVFTLEKASYITRVWTYHCFQTIGSKQPTVAFQDTTSPKTYGPWAQVGLKTFNGTLGASASDPGNIPGPPDNYWMAYPGQMVPAGTYRVVDSDPATWSYTSDLGKRGVTWVYGWLGGAPPVTPDGGVKDAAVEGVTDAPTGDAGKGTDAAEAGVNTVPPQPPINADRKSKNQGQSGGGVGFVETMPPREEEEPKILAQVDALAQALAAGNVTAAVACFHSAARASYQKVLTANPSAMPKLAEALKSKTLTFLGEEYGGVSQRPRRAEVTVQVGTLSYAIGLSKENGQWLVISL